MVMSSKDDVELTELPGVAERSPAEKTNRQDSSQVETPAAGTTKIIIIIIINVKGFPNKGKYLPDRGGED